MRITTPTQEKIQHEKNNQKNKTKHNQQKKNITIRHKNIIVKKMKFRFYFIQLPLSLTLNNAFASLGSGCCLRTLNWKIENQIGFSLFSFFRSVKIRTSFHDRFSFM